MSDRGGCLPTKATLASAEAAGNETGGFSEAAPLEFQRQLRECIKEQSSLTQPDDCEAIGFVEMPSQQPEEIPLEMSWDDRDVIGFDEQVHHQPDMPDRKGIPDPALRYHVAKGELEAYLGRQQLGMSANAMEPDDPVWQRLSRALHRARVALDASDKATSVRAFISEDSRQLLRRFEPKRWERCNWNQKQKAANALCHRLVADLRIQQPPALAFRFTETGGYGCYDKDANLLSVNCFFLEDGVEIAAAIAYSVRRCWQYERAAAPRNEQERQFRQNFAEYLQQVDDYLAYQAQPVEADALAFAQQCRELIGSNK